MQRFNSPATYNLERITSRPETGKVFMKAKFPLSTETDIAVTRTRCKSVGMIVFAAIFNNVALVFIIINFVKTKMHAAEFDRIEAKQKAAQKEAE